MNRRLCLLSMCAIDEFRSWVQADDSALLPPSFIDLSSDIEDVECTGDAEFALGLAANYDSQLDGLSEQIQPRGHVVDDNR